VSKLLGFQNEMPIQAAAGTRAVTWGQRLQSPTGLLLASGLAAFGWIVGREVGRSAREGTSLMDTTERREIGDGEEWISAVAAYGALGLTGELVVGLAKEYGWDRVLGYSGGYLVVVSAIKKFMG